MNKDCRKCGGACCKMISLPVGEFKGHMAEWAAVRGVLVKGMWHIKSTCPKLQGHECSIYEDRPEACKQYVVGGKSCLKCKEIMNN